MMRIGVDWGGSKIEAAVLGNTGEIIARKRVPTKNGDYEVAIRTVVALVREMESHAGPNATIGVGIPGMIHPHTGLVKNANSTWLIGRPLQRDLERALGREIRCENDANCFARSEAIDGAAAGREVVFAAILGTGVGGGIAVRSKVLSGENNIAGEWGHNQLPHQNPDEYPGPPCYCGKRGCIEKWLSGPSLEREYTKITGEVVPASAIAERLPAHDVVLRQSFDGLRTSAHQDDIVNQGDIAMVIIERYEDRLARALSSVINLLDPDIIVLGGGLSNIRRLYDSVPAMLPKYVFGDECVTLVVPAKHGDSSGVRGAAWLWPPQ